MVIKVLNHTVAAQIAAGEVVERPASVVKELVENSLDAGSSRVEVETGDGGISLIRISDNGSGIPPGELELAFSRYATSKVSSISDLESITTFGFRGEALPSIASVAEVEITSCAEGQPAGDTIQLDSSKVISRARRARSAGTTVSVRNLFRTVPARLKFLKSTSTENSHIARVVSHYALAFPGVAFRLVIDDRPVLDTPGNGRLLDAVIEVHGLEIARNLLEIKGSGDTWGDDYSRRVAATVSGMVGSPGISRANRDYLSFFVNRRSISNRVLTWAVEEAYQGLLMQRRHPVAIINIAIPPDEVDVNIHPTKAEVKFRNERAVFSAVQRAVRATLLNLAPMPAIEEPTASYTPPSSQTRPLWKVPDRSARTPESTPTIEPVPLVSLPALRVLGQVASSYIVAEGPDGLYLVDQHAAHERVLYEKYQHQKSEQRIEVQGLLEPVPLEVSPQQDELLREGHHRLSDSGFTIEPFGDRTYLVRAIPALLSQKDWPAMVRELLDASGEAGSSSNDWSERISISLACHGAVRAGQLLGNEEMTDLIRQLEQTEMPRTCPHGRPTVLHMSLQQMEREFRRR